MSSTPFFIAHLIVHHPLISEVELCGSVALGTTSYRVGLGWPIYGERPTNRGLGGFHGLWDNCPLVGERNRPTRFPRDDHRNWCFIVIGIEI